MMRTFRLSLVTMAVLGTFVSATSAAVTSDSIYNTSTTIEDDVVLTNNMQLNFSDGSQADFGIWTTSGKTVKLTGNKIILNVAGAGTKSAYVATAAPGGNLVLGNSDSTIEINASSNDTTIGAWAAGTKDQQGGTLSINGKSLVVKASAAGENGLVYGLYAQNATTNTTAAKATLIVNSENTLIDAKADVAGNAHGLVVMSEGVMEIKGNLEVNADTAITARGGAVLKVNESNTKTVKLNGIIDFNYDGPTSGTKVDADVTVNLTGPESYWNGNAQYSYNGKPSDDKLSVSGLKLGISAGAVWNVTKTVEESSTATGAKTVAINQLTFNDGIISVPDAAQTVQIENMTGTGGTINAKTVKNDDGSFSVAKLAVSNVVGATTLTENYVGINADDVTSEDLDNLKAVTADAASLTRQQVVSEGDINGGLSRVVNPDGTKGEVLETKNTKQDAYQTLTAMNALAWRHEMNDLTKRMGELRDSPVGIGSWARLYGSEQEYGDQNLKTRSTSVQVGTDFPVGENWKVGAALTYTNGDTSYEVGEADSDSYSGAIYGTWLSESGQFVDLIAKYTRMKSDFSLNGFNGSQDNDALSVSAEYGWHLKLNDLLFVEPQVELTYGRVFGDTFDAEANNAMTIEQDDFDSLIGRVGVRTGFYFPNNKGTVYLRVSGAYDFQGEYEYTARNAQTKRSFKDDLGGAWVEYAVGANFNLTDNAYTYVDLERTSGGEVTENWRWNVGFRYVW